MSDRPTTNDPSEATVSDLSERDLIARIQRRLSPPPGWLLVGIGDDAAVVEPERNRVEVLSVDCIVEGVHFDRAFVPPDAVGHRALAVNLSDLAAMGAEPRLALVSMMLPGALPVADFDGIAGGFSTLAARHRLHIVGGNLTRTPGPLTIDIAVIGTVKRRQALTRSGARAGDELYVTGTIGAAAAGLQILQSSQSSQSSQSPNQSAIRNPQSAMAERYLRPEPRIRAGTLLARNRVASACMDLSDGLADAVRQVAEASGVGARIDRAALPIDSAARAWFAARGTDPVTAAVAGGDDYELLVAVRPRARRRFEAAMRRADVSVTRIGVCTDGREILLDETTMPAGYGHFR